MSFVASSFDGILNQTQPSFYLQAFSFRHFFFKVGLLAGLCADFFSNILCLLILNGSLVSSKARLTGENKGEAEVEAEGEQIGDGEARRDGE